MNKWVGRIGAGFLGILLIAGVSVRYFIVPRTDAAMNAVIPHDTYTISSAAQKLHKTLRVADLHADTLLWQRNPARRHSYGHTDLPRLREGSVALQVFTAVTKSPSGLNYEENTASSSDDITKLAMVQLWPLRTWGSLFERARFQAKRLHRLARKDPAFSVIHTRKALADILDQRAQDPKALGGILGLEGAHPLEGSIENLETLYEDGYRVIGLQHFFDNKLGGSLHGISGDGLTSFGKEVIQWADKHDMIIDVAHSSPAVVRDVLALSTNPTIISHTGFEGMCSSPRNIDDSLMTEIAAKGGLIGVGFWKDVTCDDTPAGIADAIIYGVNTFGLSAIALGSDFDGTVTTTLDASELGAITNALLSKGMSEDDIAAVMGENAIRFFLDALPKDK